MKTLFRMVVLVLLVSGWGLAALSLHVIRTPQTVTVVPKNRLGVADTYVDTRPWTLAEAGAHPQVVGRLIDVEKAEVLQHVADGASEGELVRALRDAVAEHAATQPSGGKDESNGSSMAGDWIALARALDLVWDEK